MTDLDEDKPRKDEPVTVVGQWPPRRSWRPDDRRITYITAIWAAVVLVVITVLAVTPVVTLVSGTPKPVVAVALPSTSVAPTVTVTAAPPPPAPLPTVTVTQPPPPAPAEPTLAPRPTRPSSAISEANFVSAVHANIPTAAIPGGRPTDTQLVASGYEACRVMARYPDNQRRAATAFYAEQGFNISVMDTDAPVTFMDYARTFLCNPE